MEYIPGEAVWYHHRSQQVAVRLTVAGAAALNEGRMPLPHVDRVTQPTGRVHYYRECGGKQHPGTARTIQATTCKHCLMRRARRLTGWRWTSDLNQRTVQYLIEMLGHRVEGFVDLPSCDETTGLTFWPKYY